MPIFVNIEGLRWLGTLVSRVYTSPLLEGDILLLSFLHNEEQVFFSAYVTNINQTTRAFNGSWVQLEAILFDELDKEAWGHMMNVWFGVPYSGKLNNKE